VGRLAPMVARLRPMVLLRPRLRRRALLRMFLRPVLPRLLRRPMPR
jgi:hypothetical protein